MKKLLSLVLALVLLTLPAHIFAESSLGIIGGADGPTSVFVPDEVSQSWRDKALAAGRRVNQTITLTELSGVETGDAMADAAIADLIKALGFNFSAQGDEASFAMTLSGNEVATFGGVLSGEDIYLSSNMLGGTVVVGLTEIEGLANRVLDAMVAMGAISEFDAAIFREELAVLKESLEAFEAEEAAEDAVVAEMDFSALEAILPMLMSKITPVEDIIVPRMCDPAVSGLQMVLTNEDIHAVVKQACQFLLDNPVLLDSFAEAAGYPSEEQIAAEWETAGQLYMAFGIYKDEAAFRAAQKSIEKDIREVMDDPAFPTIYDGAMTAAVYLDEKDEPVYITASMPILTTEEHFHEMDGDLDMVNIEIVEKTVSISMNYTRQTVAQGVAHVCNIFADDTGVTIDVLVGDSSTFVTVTAAEPEVEPMKLLELSVTEAANAANPAVNDIDVVATAYDGENAVLNIVYDGEYECSDAREYAKGKLTLTAYAYQWPVETSVIELADAETGTVEYVDTTVTISGDDVQPEVRESIIAFDFSTDTAISGVDYTTHASFTVEAGVVRFGMQMTEATTDPEPSIMTGNVVRPAELNDTDFSNWFNGVINAFNVWLAGLFQALPESVLMLIIYSGMM